MLYIFIMLYIMCVGTSSCHPMTAEYDESKQNVQSLASKSDIRTLTLTKRRVQHFLHHVMVEQTDITIKGHKTPHWRSICFEADKLENVERVLCRQVSSAAAERYGIEGTVSIKDYLVGISMTGEACGYPQFVINLV